jgi:hypothetical protein
MRKHRSSFDEIPTQLKGLIECGYVPLTAHVIRTSQASSENATGVQFADNFGDFEDNSEMDGLYSIEDVASYKARKVFEVTGLPVITARTSFEVEPIPPPRSGWCSTSFPKPTRE